MSEKPKDIFEDADVIYAFTTQDAINDGILVDLEEVCRARNYRNPFKGRLLCTRTVFEEFINLPDGYTGSQDVTGRLHDVLFILLLTFQAGIKAHSRGMGERSEGCVKIQNKLGTVYMYDTGAAHVYFKVKVRQVPPYGNKLETADLWASWEPYTEVGAKMTIMKRGED